MLQHALYSVPNYHEGYTTDDNARALIAEVLLEAYGITEVGEASKYLAFLNYAFDPETRSFQNVLTYERRWLDRSEDAHGRALWALGTVLGRSQDDNLRGLAGYLFELALPEALHSEQSEGVGVYAFGAARLFGAFLRRPRRATSAEDLSGQTGRALRGSQCSRLALV